jgi:uncharacterized protein YyaL (SSP411 family)
MANALAQETSPYLLQHRDNPVDWLPWGQEALARAQRLDRPLLVSIGYSACHWCHVMERESFEDAGVAALMNERFVCVKVDREERPDVDAIYMEAVQGMTGRGGWPLNVFLTPEGVPFYGGTYFPPEPRYGAPSWREVLVAVLDAWVERGAEFSAARDQIAGQLTGGGHLQPSQEPVTVPALDGAVAALERYFDPDHGGFGKAPKFPQAPVIEFLLARARTSAGPRADGVEAAMALDTLHAIAAGGIHDQLAGGFHRYSVDATWTVPHFEKMLYDTALLARAYVQAYEISGEQALADTCRRSLDWALREMRAPHGGFYCAVDADSEGAEGAYYVWTAAEIRTALGDDADAAIAWLGVTEKGNFSDPHHPRPGSNVLTAAGPEPEPEQRERIRRRLLAVRAERTPPALDDKCLTSWNALMISALADAGAALEEPRYLEAANACAEFVLGSLRDERGRLLRCYAGATARLDAYLEDHAFLLEALLALFEATCQQRWLDEATGLAHDIIARFSDPERGGFFATAADSEPLIARRKDLEDSPIPAGPSSAALGLLRLAELSAVEAYRSAAMGTLALLAEIAPRHPAAFGHALTAMHWSLEPMRPIACALPGRQS